MANLCEDSPSLPPPPFLPSSLPPSLSSLTHTENYSSMCDPIVEVISSTQCPDALLKKKDILVLESPCVPEDVDPNTRHQEL